MHWFENTTQDISYAVRSWRTAPGFTFAAIATLAIAIGANTAIFSVVSGVLLRPLPFADPQNLVEIHETQPRNRTQMGFDGPVVFGDFEQWRTRSRWLEGIVTCATSARNYQQNGDLEQVPIVTAERGLFRLLGVTAIAGRVFEAGDPPRVAVASYGFWKTHLGGDLGAIGRTILLDLQPFTLIGVMPERFQFPLSVSRPGLWIPWEAPPDLTSHPTRRIETVVARLKSGVGMEAARQELNAMDGPAEGGRIVRIRPLKTAASDSACELLLVLWGAVAMVLLVACANVANLLLARAASRTREIAIRAAVGASRWRLVRQLLTESLVLAVAGGIAGLAIGMWGKRLLLQIAASQIPRAEEIAIDWRVFAFVAAASVVTGLGFGLAPAIAAARGVAGGLPRRGVGTRVRDTLAVVEIALAFVLLAGAGLLLRTFLNLERINTGIQPENVLTLHVVLSGAREAMAVEEQVAQLPGVRAAGMISLLPLQDSGWNAGFTISGSPEVHETELRFVTPGYFRAMGIPLRRGREFFAQDYNVPGRVLINEALARLHFSNQDPVGRRTDRGTIIGVVGDVRQTAKNLPPKPEMYFASFAQLHNAGSTLIVRGIGPPEAQLGAIRAAIRKVRPHEAVFRVAAMQTVIDESLSEPRLYAWLVGLFATIGTLLAAAGIYGVIAYLVTLRASEFGIRMALGADATDVLRLVLGRGTVLTALGLAIGVAGAAALTRVLRGVLYGLAATDFLTFAVGAAGMAAIALGACWIPARRAARTDPSVALRCE